MRAENKPLFRGCRWVEERDGELTPLRFDKARLRAYASCPIKPYARCPVGVRLDFVTAAPEIRFRCRVVERFRGTVAIDLYENGILADTRCLEQETELICFRRQNSGESRITVYLPSNAELRLSELELGDARPVEERRPLLLVLGDSISQGLFGTHPSLAWVPLVMRQRGFEALNLSVGGDRYDPEWLDDTGCRPQQLVVALGTNDYACVSDDGQIRRDTAAYYDRLAALYPGVPVRVVTPPYVAGLEETDQRRLEGIRAMIAGEASRRGHPVTDGNRLIPHQPEFFTDEAHPNDLGFSQYALNFLRETG